MNEPIQNNLEYVLRITAGVLGLLLLSSSNDLITAYLIALSSILLSITSTFYYIRVVKILYFENLLIGKLVSTDQDKKSPYHCCFIFTINNFVCSADDSIPRI